MRIWDIFYYYYDAISDWSQQMRIALNLAVASLLLFFFLRVTYPVWRPFSIRIGIGLRKIFYLVLVPSMPDLKVPKALQVVYRKYDCLEKEALAKARIIQEKEEQEAGETAQAEQKDENASLEFLQLTKLGESGAYLRKKPDKEAKVEAVLKGQVRMEKIKADDENNPAWFKVKLEDGRKGWIHVSIVEAVQE